MGRSFLFECPKCGYKAKVSGCPDQGFSFQVQTILCQDCKALYDAVVGLKISRPLWFEPFLFGPRAASRRTMADGPPPFDAVFNRLPFPERHFSWAQFRIACPVSAWHQVRAWNEPDKCPKCGIYLEKNALPFRIWE